MWNLISVAFPAVLAGLVTVAILLIFGRPPKVKLPATTVPDEDILYREQPLVINSDSDYGRTGDISEYIIWLDNQLAKYDPPKIEKVNPRIVLQTSNEERNLEELYRTALEAMKSYGTPMILPPDVEVSHIYCLGQKQPVATHYSFSADKEVTEW